MWQTPIIHLIHIFIKYNEAILSNTLSNSFLLSPDFFSLIGHHHQVTHSHHHRPLSSTLNLTIVATVALRYNHHHRHLLHSRLTVTTVLTISSHHHRHCRHSQISRPPPPSLSLADLTTTITISHALVSPSSPLSPSSSPSNLTIIVTLSPPPPSVCITLDSFHRPPLFPTINSLFCHAPSTSIVVRE